MHVAIIGNGVTGTTTARYVRKVKDWDITVISSETEHHFSRTALMYVYMGHMKYEHTKPYEDWFWDKNEIDLVYDHVTDINIQEKQLQLRENPPIGYDKLVIATGSQTNKFDWPGQDLDGVQGLYSYPDLLRMEENTRDINRAVIVGGGLIGIEVAEMLRTRNIPVTFLAREKNYRDNVMPGEEARMINREIRRHKVDLRLATELGKILPDNSGRVRAVVTKEGEEIPCEFVALTPGVHPNLELVESGDIATDKGILVNHYFETNQPDIYAAGDCAEFTDAAEDEPAIEQLWYTGRKQGEALARILCGERKKYDRGIWFNSAKFFNIEWQIYGKVSPKLPDDEKTFYWESPDGTHSLRINFKQKNQAITGVNVMGIRLRQVVCERWIEEGQTLEYALQNLGEAMFDPEFTEQHEKAIIEHYNKSNPDKNGLHLKRKRGLFGLFQFWNKKTA
ncbi:MAG TPA: FAD/NAD(P)-binding oxidoreductase [Balneolaceae bacterium]|nr:FAD/NAD(P)-binding oxidoreductase [Balneolaceae bacterium]